MLFQVTPASIRSHTQMSERYDFSEVRADQRAGWSTCSSQSHMAEQQMLWLSIWQ
jgi:hypothetical protein